MKIIIVTIVSLLLSTSVFADITFTNGKWETTFDCSEQDQDSWNCDGAETYGSWTCGGTTLDAITSGANYSNGGGGRGFRHYEGDGTNNNGGGISFELTNPASELWMRFYIRYASGFEWTTLTYDKILYPVMNGGDATWVLSFAYDNEIVVADETLSVSWLRVEDVGYFSIYSGGVSDGSWHCLEVYVKVNTGTSTSDGVGRVWLDGTFLGERTDMNFSGGYSAALSGTKSMRIGSNQATPNNSGCVPVDFDDIVMYNTTPPNRDSQDNAFIGPIGYSSSTIKGITIN